MEISLRACVNSLYYSASTCSSSGQHIFHENTNSKETFWTQENKNTLHTYNLLKWNNSCFKQKGWVGKKKNKSVRYISTPQVYMERLQHNTAYPIRILNHTILTIPQNPRLNTFIPNCTFLYTTVNRIVISAKMLQCHWLVGYMAVFKEN